jgi:hypothetical protein
MLNKWILYWYISSQTIIAIPDPKYRYSKIKITKYRLKTPHKAPFLNKPPPPKKKKLRYSYNALFKSIMGTIASSNVLKVTTLSIVQFHMKKRLQIQDM